MEMPQYSLAIPDSAWVGGAIVAGGLIDYVLAKHTTAIHALSYKRVQHTAGSSAR